MGKKRGRKASYVAYAGEEVRETIKGRDYGVSLHKNTKNYYMMIPTETGTKRKWLGSDLAVAVVKYRAIVSDLKGLTTHYIETPISFSAGRNTIKTFAPMSEELKNLKPVGTLTPESHYIEWLKKELQNPKELAKKTGIEAIADLKIVQEKTILLIDFLNNYINKIKEITGDEKQCSKRFYKEFCKIVDSKTVNEITLHDIHNYEKFINSQKLSAKYKTNKINKVSTIVNYNCGRYESDKVLQLHKWLRGIHRPEDDKPFNPIEMKKEDFEKLYESCKSTKWKLMLLFGLNCAMYPVDLTRLKKENINLKEGTVAFRRGKTGKVLAVSTLWSRTIKLLEQQMKEERTEYIFTSYKKSPYSANGITNTFNQTIRKKAGVDSSVKFSHLRDTFATMAQDLGYSIEQINLVLGHQNKGMQDRYAVRNAGKLTKELCEAVEKEFFQIK